jgi:CheY-like chemotaxis protein
MFASLLSGTSATGRGGAVANDADERTPSLTGYRVLVVEDEYFIADDLRIALERCGAKVIGPVGRLAEAATLLEGDVLIDLAVLDIDLHGEKAYGLAEMLRERGVPLVFATGYGADAIPAAYAAVPRWEKPYPYQALLAALPSLAVAAR